MILKIGSSLISLSLIYSFYSRFLLFYEMKYGLIKKNKLYEIIQFFTNKVQIMIYKIFFII